MAWGGVFSQQGGYLRVGDLSHLIVMTCVFASRDVTLKQHSPCKAVLGFPDAAQAAFCILRTQYGSYQLARWLTS